MTPRRRPWVLTHRAPQVLIRGHCAGDALRSSGFKPLWSVSGRGWVLDDRHLPDIAAIASLRARSYRVVHTDGSDCECVNLRGEGRRVVEAGDADPSDLCTCARPTAAGELVALLADQLGAVEIGHYHKAPT